MKKKFRKIVVDGIEYAWLVEYIDKVVIFKDKKRIFRDKVSTSPITPKTIEIIIRAFLALETVKSLSDEELTKLLSECPFEESGWCCTELECRFKLVGVDKDNGCELCL